MSTTATPHDPTPGTDSEQIHLPALRVALLGDDAPCTRLAQKLLEDECRAFVRTTDSHRPANRRADESFDLVAICLPDLNPDTLAQCRSVRAAAGTPVLALSTDTREEALVAALDAGADDFIAYPLRPNELRARVNALVRRVREALPAKELIVCDELTINAARRRVSRSGRDIHLTRTEFEILHFLARRRGKVQRQETILAQVWGPYHGEYVQTLRVHIGHIRHKIEMDPSAPHYIETEPGVGYRFRAENA